MQVFLKLLFVCFSAAFTAVGILMLVAPTKYPSLYSGFLRESVTRRETTERGKQLAIRIRGLIWLVSGALFGLFYWAIV
jgi:hypothetical protein